MESDRLEVKMTAGALDDLAAIHHYLRHATSRIEADLLLDRFVERTDALGQFPLRGSIPRELESLGIRDFRQIVLPPYRILYRVERDTVFIHLIADGRRDMQTVLSRRLLGA